MPKGGDCGIFGKMYRYVSEKEELFSEDFGVYTSFGVRVYHGGREIIFVSDVSPDEIYVRDFARRCTEYQLDPIHFFDVVENEN